MSLKPELQLPLLFRKYPKISGLSYVAGFPQTEEVERKDIKFYVSEKIDGANVGIHIGRNGELGFYSRSGLNADGLFNFHNDKLKLDPFIEYVREHFDDIAMPSVSGLYFWGEYFYNSINGRIDYGKIGQFKIFDAACVDENKDALMVSPESFIRLYNELDDPYKETIWLPTIIDSAKTMEDVVNNCPIPYKSQLSKDNLEGWVITATADNFYMKWKYKDPAFGDKHIPKIPVILDSKQQSYKEQYATYFNENRAIDLLSKYPTRDLGVLMPAFIKDAQTDFMTDHPELEGVERRWLGKVFGVGKTPFKVLMATLEKESERL